MPVIAGIYGYEITRPMELYGLHIEPRTSDLQEARGLARDLDTYNLTATITGDSITPEFLFNLEAVLSFIEHLDVLVSSPVEHRVGDKGAQLLPSIATHRRNGGGGAVIGEDAFFSSSRRDFILLAMSRLQDATFCDKTQFNILFFKCVETFRQRRPFIEVTYFLLYSGLESFARSVQNDKKNKNSSEPIFRLLSSYRFAVHLENPKELHRAISTYTHLRNALFHNSEFEACVNSNGAEVELRLVDYLFNLSMLVSLTILKAVTFDDGHINWDAWIDRQLFK